MGLAIALGLGLIVILAVGHGSDASAQGPMPAPQTGPTPEQLERKRLLVQKAFLAALQRRVSFIAANRIQEAQQTSKNDIAAYFRSRGIPLGAPDPAIPFWQMPEPELARFLSDSVNSYTPVKIGPAQIVR